MAGRRSTARLMVDGMSCSNCEKRIEKAVSALEVNRVFASAPLSEVMVYYDADLVSREAICASVTAAGYQVREQPARVSEGGAAVREPNSEPGKSRNGGVYRFHRGGARRIHPGRQRARPRIPVYHQPARRRGRPP